MITSIFIPLSFWLILTAVLLDSIFTKQYRFTHPVVFIGKLLEVLERRGRAWSEQGVVGIGRFRWRVNLYSAGKFCLIVAVFCTANVVYWLCAVPVIGLAIAMLLSVLGLALGNLLYEAGKAANAIEFGTLEEGQRAVSMLVSRDTRSLDQDGLRRALAETVSENFNDGFVAPLFWLAVGGPVTLWVYKCVSTADSMWGYHTEKYEQFGKASAKLDDILAFIPARISAVLLWMAGPFVLRGAWPWLFKRIKADAATMESPNAGWPMATAAWMHGVHMGGPACYFGVMKDKPILGPKDSESQWTHAHLRKLFRHVRYAGLLGAVLALALSLIVKGLVKVVM